MDKFESKGDTLIKYNGNEKVVIIPEGITAIGDRAFYNNQTIEIIKLPETLLEIGEKAFSCLSDSYQSVTIPKNVYLISSRAFDCDYGLKEIHIESTKVSIAIDAFDHCYEIRDIYFSGTPEQWKAIIQEDEDDGYPLGLSNAKIHYKV